MCPGDHTFPATIGIALVYAWITGTRLRCAAARPVMTVCFRVK
jgi:hypothetical protein